MRVLIERQPEVSDIGLLIHRLSECPDHQSLEQCTVRPRCQPLDQLAKLAWGRLLGEVRADLHGVHHFLQLGHPLLFRLAVDAVQAFRLREAQRHRRLHVRRDHAFLDETVRVVAHHRVEALDLAVLADARLDLTAAKIERAARIARRFERAVNGVQLAQRRAHGFA